MTTGIHEHRSAPLGVATQGLDPTGLAESFRRRALRSPLRPALSFGADTWSYGALQERIEALSAVLAAGGVGAGDRVAYVGFNHPVTLTALFAAARLGAIFVPLNFRLSAPELEFVINDAGVHTLIVGDAHTAVIGAVRPSLCCQRYLGSGTPTSGWEDLELLLSNVLEIPPAINGNPDEVVLMLYTSGTTGSPKGVMLTNANLWVSNLNSVLTSDFSSRDVVLNCAPLFHAGGLTVMSLPTLAAGGHLVLHESFEPSAFLRALEACSVTVGFAVPAMMLALSQNPKFETVDLSTLRMMATGAAPVPEPLLRRFHDRGIPVSHLYGMTEATTAVTFLDPDFAAEKLGSCGRPGVLSEVRLVDFVGHPITDPWVEGEVCLRGGTITKGYWNRPDATAALLDADGWLRSGDVGYFDAGGFLYLCDRVKDMIITGGENVYPAEVENVLYGHPAIAEVAVIGGPDETWGERVICVAALTQGATLSLEELQVFAGEWLARYKLPREMHLVDALPRNANGKVVKSELRVRFAAAVATPG
jgi:fatty-acyl-CoA synthase